jgi:hypothetical protein
MLCFIFTNGDFDIIQVNNDVSPPLSLANAMWGGFLCYFLFLGQLLRRKKIIVYHHRHHRTLDKAQETDVSSTTNTATATPPMRRNGDGGNCSSSGSRRNTANTSRATGNLFYFVSFSFLLCLF